jgi:transposase InsO family protein
MKLKNPIIIGELRKFYFSNSWSHSEVKAYLLDHYKLDVGLRTLKRWKKCMSDPKWKGPKVPLPPVPTLKATQNQILRICTLRKKTGWGALPLKHIFKFGYSESTYKRIIKVNGLSRGSKIENQRIHWVKWQREHPDSLWQLDGHKDDQGHWLLPVIDDCSRYCVGLKKFETLTTEIVTGYLEAIFAIHGVPRELLTDNGTEFGGLCRTSQFDQWCEKWGIKHIRARPKKPTTPGKVERHHLTFNHEITFCNGDIELFRYRYNHVRPHRSLHMKTPAQVYFDLQIRIKGIGFKHSKW